jgi:23S rRNA (guanosine2251-2'-O)-methyltransferase
VAFLSISICFKLAVQYLVYGKHSARECLKNGNRKILRIWCVEKFYLANIDLISKFKFEIVSNAYLDNLVDVSNHQGVIIEVLQNTCATNEISAWHSKVAILDSITDPHNLGAIIRSAVAFGFDAVITGKANSAGESATVTRVASGALEHIDLLRVTNISRMILSLKEKGFWIVGLDSDAAHFIEHPLMNSTKIAIVLGSEGLGLRPLISKSCDVLVKIPMSNSSIASINVSNAAAIAFYLVSRNLKSPSK